MNKSIGIQSNNMNQFLPIFIDQLPLQLRKIPLARLEEPLIVQDHQDFVPKFLIENQHHRLQDNRQQPKKILLLENQKIVAFILLR